MSRKRIIIIIIIIKKQKSNRSFRRSRKALITETKKCVFLFKIKIILFSMATDRHINNKQMKTIIFRDARIWRTVFKLRFPRDNREILQMSQKHRHRIRVWERGGGCLPKAVTCDPDEVYSIMSGGLNV